MPDKQTVLFRSMSLLRALHVDSRTLRIREQNRLLKTCQTLLFVPLQVRIKSSFWHLLNCTYLNLLDCFCLSGLKYVLRLTSLWLLYLTWLLKSTLLWVDLEELSIFLHFPHPHFPSGPGMEKKITNVFGPLITGESGKPSSIPSANILHTLTLTVDKEDYIH